MNDMRNCPNCGAPLAGEKCEYCGTICSSRMDFSRLDDALMDEIRLESLKIKVAMQAHEIAESVKDKQEREPIRQHGQEILASEQTAAALERTIRRLWFLLLMILGALTLATIGAALFWMI